MAATGWMKGLCAIAALCAACAVPMTPTPIISSPRVDGRLKADRMARNAPFTNADLLDHFRRTAFGAEFSITDGAYIKLDPVPNAPLKRWGGDVIYALAGTVRRSDIRHADDLATRLEARTGLTIRPAAQGTEPNLILHFMDRQARMERRLGLVKFGSNDPTDELFLLWSQTPEWPCAGEFYYQNADSEAPFQIEYAVIYIRDDLRGLSRLSCIEEEMSQAMGLARDDSTVRPSIFNDDDEFALLTEHDELLLRVLYDPRLAPGMTTAEALPIAARIIDNLRPWTD